MEWTNAPSKAKLCATNRETSAHKKFLAHINFPFKNVFAHISYTSFQIHMSPGKMLHKSNFMRTQTFKKVRRNIGLDLDLIG